ncbi:hypothetical protein VST7929_02495 [Vibrio stylophorae]|uniref:AB hydrolase-1 domain-containing protein n=1 Tax=Vibrio stylophorae TaxID=659351 RepID=A0ABM8ZW26_9VIBR|nr:hydrolase [Vibrio stylophorae]CAH0534551.1 hypothetical protein VST7929_02495 [Vibrio stylophorae]
MPHVFTPAKGLSNCHVQTLLPRLLHRKPSFSPLWQTWSTPDGDTLELAWAGEPKAKQPMAILFHGLEGSFDSPYAHGLLAALKAQGWCALMLHFRSCGRSLNQQFQSYHAGDTRDIRWVIEQLNERYLPSHMVAIGVSIGGNMLLNYLAEQGSDTPLCAATAISAPIDLASCSQRIEQGFSRIYQRYLLSSLKQKAAEKLSAHPHMAHSLQLNTTDAKQIQTLYQFDDRITAPSNGFANAQDYYQRASAKPKLHQIAIPTQMIHAKDDPFMTDSVILTQHSNPHIDYQLSEHGGHVGFVSGTLRQPKFWLEHQVPAWFAEHR